MLLEPENRLATPLKVPPPTRTFAINPLNYQASAAGEAVPWAAPRGRGGAWIGLGCWRCGPGTVVNSFVSTPPLSDSHTAHFCVPTAQRTPARADGYRWLLGVATPLSRPEYHSHMYHAPAQPRASLPCSPPHLSSLPLSFACLREDQQGRESFLFVQV